jgi:hypothetical protein
LGHFTTTQEQCGDPFEFFRRREIPFSRFAPRRRQRQAVVSLHDCLRQRAFGHFSSGVRRCEQGAILRERCAQFSCDIEIARDIRERFVLASLRCWQ